MKTKIQRLIPITLVLLGVALLIPISSAFAATPHTFSLIATDYNMLDDSGTGDEYANGDQIDPGRVIQLSLYYEVGDGDNYSFQSQINYDPNLVEPLYDEGDFVVDDETVSIGAGGIWPNSGTSSSAKKKTNWSLSANLVTDENCVVVVAYDSKKTAPMTEGGVIASFWFKVKDDAPAGSTVKFTFAPGQTKIGTTGVTIATTDLSLSVYGSMQNDVSLSTLTLTGNNSLVYPTEFVSGTTTRTFSTVVPNSVGSITIAATPTDTNAKVLAGGLGNKVLSVGNNPFNLTVQAQDGTQEIYAINVYRLNNDAKLGTLSLSGLTLSPTFSSGTYSYTATAPYATTSTTVTATANDANAKGVAGTGLKNLSVGSNQIDVVVSAESCLDTYQSVPGNSCSTQTYTVNVNRTAASTDKALTGITINGTAITGFSPSTLNYTVADVANATSSVTIGATLSDSKASVTGTGTKSLNVGDNTLSLTVTAEDGSSQTYTVSIHRKSNDTKLDKITITSTPQGTLSPAFTPTFYNYYTYTYAATVSDIVVAASLPTGSAASITSGPGTYPAGTASVNIVVTAEDGTVGTYVIKLERQKSDDATLSALSIAGVSFNEGAFTSSTTRYSATVDGTVSSVNVSATPNFSGASVESGTGTINLGYGLNTIKITVRAENGTTTKDYYIDVTRSQKTIATLSDLKVDGTTVSGFRKDWQTYDLGTVAYEKTSINISATATDAPDATVTGTGVQALKTGSNTFTVTVTAQDGTTKLSYTITVYRTKSNDATLSGLTITGGSLSPSFATGTTSYTVAVPYEVSTTTITATPTDSAATVVGDGTKNLNVGDNTFDITVTAEDGSASKLYSVKFTRAQSNKVDLAGLSVKSGTTEYLTSFAANTTTYNLTVPYAVSSVNITATGLSTNPQTITGDGTKNLASGLNTFTVVVDAPSGDSRTYTLNITRLPNENNNLGSLAVTGYTISPTFSAGNTSYTLTVPSTVTEVTVTATVETGSGATILSGTGRHTLNTGTNTINVIVQAESTATKTYVIVVTRAASNDSSLKSLSLDEALFKEGAFVSSTTAYTADVPYTVTSVHVNATANDSKAKNVTGTGEHPLNTGANTINVVVTAEDNTTATYTITVNRAKNTDATLSSLSVAGVTLSPSFDASVVNYTATVPNSVAQVNISATPSDSIASVSNTGSHNLNSGANTITLTVTAEDVSVTKDYTIIITRELNSDTALQSLTSTDGIITPAFAAGDTNRDYSLTVPYEVENANLVATATAATSTVAISGHGGLVVGANSAVILVTAEDGSTDTYNVNITRLPSSNNFLSSLRVTDAQGKNYIAVFNRATLTYNLTVDNTIDSVRIDATPEDLATTVRGTGDKALTVGANQFIVDSVSADNTARQYIINITRSKNGDTNLGGLSVTGLTMVPNFSATETSYLLTVDNDVTNVEIVAYPANTASTVTGTGPHALVTGVNNFPVTVTAENGDTKTYTIVISRASSSNNYLASLATNFGLGDGVTFDRDVLEYSLDVPNTATSIDINAVVADANATLSGTGTFNIAVGNNSYLVTVTAEDNSFRVYTINVYREPSTNAHLSDLRVAGQTVSGFSRSQIKYSWSVGNEVTELAIEGVPEDSTASVAGNKTHFLKTGLNTINIVVTAESGYTKTYTLEITRAKSSNNILAELSALEGTLSPALNRNDTEYSISVPYETTSLTLTTRTEDANAKTEIEGNTDFQVGSDNHVYLSVVAEDGSIRTYHVQVTRQQQANNFLNSLTIISDSGNPVALSPAFSSNTMIYHAELDPTTANIFIQGSTESSTATTTGLGSINIPSLPYTHEITVTSAGNVSRTYTIVFDRAKSGNANLKSLSTDTGVLVPGFSESIQNYSIQVKSNINQINVSALGYDGSTIAGTGLHDLEFGANTITITVAAEDGTTKQYTIEVTRESRLYDTDLVNLTVSGAVLRPSFQANTLDYLAYMGTDTHNITVTATPSDNGSTVKISVNNGAYTESRSVTIGDLNHSTSVRIKVENSGESNIYTVALLIQSDELITSYTYGHHISDEYITSGRPETAPADFIQQFDNDSTHLKLYKADGVTEHTEGNVGTGMIIKLFSGSQVADQKRIIIPGDTTGDGLVNVQDVVNIVNYLLGGTQLPSYYIEAGDTVTDGTLNIIDASRIVNHIIGQDMLY